MAAGEQDIRIRDEVLKAINEWNPNEEGDDEYDSLDLRNFGTHLLKERERREDQANREQECAAKGHFFLLEGESAPLVFGYQNGSYRVEGWKFKPVACTVCGGKLVFVKKEEK